jgi:sugar phosphate isomerase/epimerase
MRNSLYSRREFGGLLLAGIPFSMALAGQIDPRHHGVRIGVQSYSFRTMPLEDAIKAMVAIGIGECELFSGHVEPRPQVPAGAQPAGQRGPNPAMREAQREWRLTTSLDHFVEVRKKFEAAGIKLQSYNLSFNDSFTDEEIDRGFEMAKALGVGFLTASSTVSASERIARYADKHQMKVAMHNHDNLKDPNQFATPASFAAAMAHSKYIGVNLDIGHFTAANFNPMEYIEQHHARITNLHIKDRQRDHGANVPWGTGDTPIREVLQLLKRKKYDIPVNIEYEYRGDDAIAEVRKCFQFIKDALA